ncbi:hypothetical protein OIU84_026859 [Salix udensis]|uniref:Uncharacterized protein n=1 Tax=Salix udensis TaxID=889485 RepID=A0AAD6KGB1_9ROSI|nr:hypothetical protein OIU84_026859 [Salix udensis]
MSATAVAATVASASNKCFRAHNNLHLLRHHHSNSYKHKDNNNNPLLFLCKCRLLLGPSSTNSSTAFHASFPFLFNTSYTTPPSWNPNALLSSPSSSSTPFRPPNSMLNGPAFFSTSTPKDKDDDDAANKASSSSITTSAIANKVRPATC